MIEEFKYEGKWWLPDKPEEKIIGTLKYTPGKEVVLDLEGSFGDLRDIKERPTILGFSPEGKYITLYKCVGPWTSYHIPGYPKSSFHAIYVFIGAHFQKKEDIKFKRLYVHYSHLNEWVDISGFEKEHDIQHLFDKEEKEIKYKLPKSIQAAINDDYKIFIDFRAYPESSEQEVCIKQRTYIKIEPSEERSFGEFLNILHHIQNFLSLGTMKPVYPLTIEGITEANNPVEIFYSLPYTSKAPMKLPPFDMLFTFKDISDRFEVFLRNWFEKADLLEPVYDLYFGTLYTPDMYIQHQFLSLIQAIESFHRRRYGGKYLPDDDYKRVRDVLENAIPDEVENNHRQSLESRIRYGNEFSLRTRLKEIFDKYQENLNEFIERKEAFIGCVVDTRNYLTHYEEDPEKCVARGEDLYHFIQKLKILLEICLLTELGFSSEEIKDLFSRNRRFRHKFIQ
ncbi:MAG TPA: hypothetical protein C5S37_13335 [Methanophagales archaeon]|nr:hypothetical protein [Methanophagales archaeon]